VNECSVSDRSRHGNHELSQPLVLSRAPLRARSRRTPLGTSVCAQMRSAVGSKNNYFPQPMHSQLHALTAILRLRERAVARTLRSGRTGKSSSPCTPQLIAPHNSLHPTTHCTPQLIAPHNSLHPTTRCTPQAGLRLHPSTHHAVISRTAITPSSPAEITIRSSRVSRSAVILPCTSSLAFTLPLRPSCSVTLPYTLPATAH
jgi:hypothetical protein